MLEPDDIGIVQSSVAMRTQPPPAQAFVAIPGVVAVGVAPASRDF